MQKKVIVASFDNVLLNQGPVQTYAALKAYSKVLSEGLITDHTKFVYKGFVKQDISPSFFINSSLFSKGFFCIAFNKLRHLAKSDEDYLKILMLIERNKEAATRLQSANNVYVYKMFVDAIRDNPIELGKESIGRISIDQSSKVYFSTVFKEIIKELYKNDWPNLLRMYCSDKDIVPQLRQVVTHLPLYFVTAHSQEIVDKFLAGFLSINYLAREDFKNLDTKWVYSKSLLKEWKWEMSMKYIITGDNILTLLHNSRLPEILSSIAIKEGVMEKDVWFLTTKFSHQMGKLLFEKGFRRLSPLNEGAPSPNVFLIASQDPFPGQYSAEIGAGVIVLEHDKFAEKLLKIASLYSSKN